jgi:hypothetical protein
MQKQILLILLVPYILLFNSCEKTADFYFGLTMQPDFVVDDFNPGLNIFGIIRPDDKSFVHVQKVIRAVGDTTTDLEIKNATIVVYPLINGQVADTLSFLTDNENSLSYNQYKPVESFFPVPGQSYELKCIAEGLPELGAVTSIPSEPEIYFPSLQVTSGKIEFEILTDTSAYLYIIYLKGGESVQRILLLPAQNRHTAVTLNTTVTENMELFIYACDQNLANYMINSNTAFNINKFRQYDNQVTNGYGVFGSLNFTSVKL